MNPFYTTTGDDTSYIDALAVTPNDGVDLVPPSGNARPTRGIMVGGAGTLKVTMASGNTVTMTMAAGVASFIQDISVVRVWATGTTATLIVALY
jgi:hypothetical protein